MITDCTPPENITTFASTIISPILLKLFKQAFTVTPRYLYSYTSPILIPLKFQLLYSFAPFIQTTFDIFLSNFHTIFANASTNVIKNHLQVMFNACHQAHIICILDPAWLFFSITPFLFTTIYIYIYIYINLVYMLIPSYIILSYNYMSHSRITFIPSLHSPSQT